VSKVRAPRAGTAHMLSPAGLLDMFDARVTDHTGHTVIVTQPHGCPRNGTMGMAYVNCDTCSIPDERPFFVGLVNIASLVRRS